ncbi:MAG: DNA integrity scanning protein DisA nucleotide-binding domain protein [Ilumatobacteraceae bacterium]
MDSPRVLTAGRMRRLTEELVDEHLGVIESSSDPEALVDELDYALRPPRHERHVPSYGSFVLPTRPIAEWNEPTGLEFFVSEARERADDDVRRYADGISSWTIRKTEGVTALVVFDRPAGSERDLVVLAGATGATIAQRHPNGLVRLVGSFGVVRWDGVGWHREPPIDAWLMKASGDLDDDATSTLDRFLRFAVHDLGARGVGTIIVFRPSDPESPAFEHRLPTPPPLRIDRPSDLGPLRHVLSQVDGAAVFDTSGTLRRLGVRLVPSPASEIGVDAFRGTRHTSARRYSWDDPNAIVIVVSEEGPITVMREGRLVGRSPVVDGLVQPGALPIPAELDLRGAEHRGT